MRFLVATTDKPFLNTLSRVFRNTRCANTWMISDIDLYDASVRRKLPPGTIWVKPSVDELTYVRHDDQVVISVPVPPNQTFTSFQTALHILDAIHSRQPIDWVAVSPFGHPDSVSAKQMLDAYIGFDTIE